MSLRRMAFLALKETWHILRDVRTLFMALGIPLVYIILFGYVLSADVNDIPLVLVDQDRSPLSREIVSGFERTGYFRVVARHDDTRPLLDHFRHNRAKAAIVIPRGLEKAVARGEEAPVQVIVDGTNANEATIAQGYALAVGQALSVQMVQSSLEHLGAGAGAGGGLRLEPRNWFNSNLASQWYLVPGLVAVIMSMMTTILMALTVAREWETGTMEQLLVTPVHPLEIVIGKLTPYFVIGFLQLILIAASGVLLFKVPIRGSMLLLAFTSAVFMLGGLGWGLFISIITRQQQLAMQLSLISTIIPSVLLSGFMTPIAAMPKIIQYITMIFPARYFLVILRGLFLKDLPLAAIWPDTQALLIYTAVVLTLCALRFRTEVA